MNIRHAFVIWASLSLVPAAHANTIDITEHLKAIMTCNVEAYKPGEEGFEIDEFNEAWVSCAPARQELLDALPKESQAEWISRFETIRTSMIARFQPQPGQSGYGLNPDEPVLIGGLAQGPARTRHYFQSMETTDGLSVSVVRLGSCCRFKTANALIGDHAALDKYELTDENGNKTIVFVNIYDEGQVSIPPGFRKRTTIATQPD